MTSEEEPPSEDPKSARLIKAGVSVIATAIGAAIIAAAQLLGEALVFCSRMGWRAIVATMRAIGKVIITTWRLAAALDSALWRALKLVLRNGAAAAAIAIGWAAAACRSLVLWLPTRTGRAYSAFSGVVLIIAALWIIDELRAGPSVDAGAPAAMRPPIDDDDPILARIEGRYVHLSEIEAAARAGGFLREDETLTPTSAFDRELVESYVEQRLLARAALDSGLQRTPTVRRRVNAARDRVLAASFMELRLRDAVRPETVRALFNATADVTRLGDEVRARQILVETGEEAQNITELLAGGAEFGALAREHSKDRDTAVRGGDIGWFTEAMMEPVFAKAVFAATEGEVAPPFQTEFGWHIIEVTGRRASKEVPFSSVKGSIEEYLRHETIDTTLNELEEENQVVYFRPDEEEAPSPPPPDLSTGAAGEGES